MTPPPNDSNDNPSATSLSLLARIRRQDPDAWSRLVHLYAPLVHRWCLSAGCSENDAADVCQEVFKAVFTSLDGFRKDRPSDTFRGWLRVITRNRIRKMLSQKLDRETAAGGSAHGRQMANLQEIDVDLGEDNEQQETSELYTRAMELIKTEFEESSWRAFWRTAVDGCKAPFVAEELGISAMAVRKAKSRVLARLRMELGETLEG